MTIGWFWGTTGVEVFALLDKIVSTFANKT
jgi:hypothetical protein